MRRLAQVFMPNRSDLFVMIVCIVAFLSIQAWWGYEHFHGRMIDYFALPLAIGTGAVLAASAMVLAWGHFYWKRTVLMILVSCLAFAFPVVVEFLFDGTLGANSLEKRWRLNGETSPYYRTVFQRFFQNGAMAIAAVFFVTLVGIFGFRHLIRWIRNSSAIATGKYKITRPRILIGIAVCLFVAAMLNNVLKATGIRVSGVDSELNLSEMILTAAVTVLIPFLMLTASSWILIFHRSRWLKLMVWTGVVGILIFSASEQLVGFTKRPLGTWHSIALLAGAGILYLSTIVCLAVPASPAEPESEQSTKHLRKISRWPSGWAAIPVFSLLVIGFLAFFVQPPVGSGSNSFTEVVDGVVQSTKLQLSTDGQIRGSGDYRICLFDAETAPDILSKLGMGPNLTSVQFFDFQPHIDTEILRSGTSQIAICGGIVTPSQLEDLLYSSAWSQIQDLEVEKSDRKATIETNAQLYLHFSEPGKLGRFLSSIEKFVNPNQIQIRSSISESDWRAIVNASQTSGEISIFGRIPANVERGNRSLKNVVIEPVRSDRPVAELTPSMIRLIRDSDIRVISNAFYDNQFYWDMCFAIPDRMWNGPVFSSTNRFVSFVGNAENFHFVYGRDQDGSASKMFIPAGDELAAAGKLTSLKSLSFDVRWLNRSAGGGGPVADLNYLSNLVNLESLYLSDSQLGIRDLSFLVPLTSLKHLQMPVVDRMAQGSVGFDSFPSLESITFFGKPDATAFRELKRLKRLKKLTIVDSQNEIKAYDEFQEKLQLVFPKIELNVFDPLKYEPEIPDEFKQHLKDTSKKVFVKLMKEAESNYSKKRKTSD